jgi:hypothetical protein
LHGTCARGSLGSDIISETSFDLYIDCPTSARGMAADAPLILARLLRGETEYVVSHPGRSQYSAEGRGASACGLAVLNCARLVLQSEQNGTQGAQLLQRMISQDFSEVKDLIS